MTLVSLFRLDQLTLIGSMSPWVLPDRTLFRQYPGRHRPYQLSLQFTCFTQGLHRTDPISSAYSLRASHRVFIGQTILGPTRDYSALYKSYRLSFTGGFTTLPRLVTLWDVSVCVTGVEVEGSSPTVLSPVGCPL